MYTRQKRRNGWQARERARRATLAARVVARVQMGLSPWRGRSGRWLRQRFSLICYQPRSRDLEPEGCPELAELVGVVDHGDERKSAFSAGAVVQQQGCQEDCEEPREQCKCEEARRLQSPTADPW